MTEFRWTKMYFFLILLLQFKAAVTGREAVVKVGDEVTLLCGNVDKDRDSCGDVEWLFAGSGGRSSVVLISSGQIGKLAGDKSDRLSVPEKCSLVLKNVTTKDVGQYTCKQLQKSGEHINLLSVITMTEHQSEKEVTLKCSLVRSGPCKHKVKWLYDVDEDHTGDSQPQCSVTYSFSESSIMPKSKLRKLFKCELTNLESQSVKTFNFSRQSTGEKPGDETTAPTTSMETTETSKITDPANMNWLLYVVAATGAVVALLITIVVIVICKRTKGNKTQVDENTGQSLNLAVTESAPETSRDTADPEDGVSYASVSYIKNTSKARVKNNDDEEDTVTYSTVKTSSSSARVPDDASGLYATVNKPRK